MMASIKQLILASQSPFRKALLESTGIEFTVKVAPIDEHAVLAPSAETQALARAEAKALAVAKHASDSLVIGADQVLSFQGQMFDKVLDSSEARQRLRQLSGQKHQLHSATVLAYLTEAGAKILARDLTQVTMPMRSLTEAEIEAYISTGEWQGSVGCYQYEHRGVHLFSGVAGDHSAIVGLPLQPLLAMLRSLGIDTLNCPKGPWSL